MFQRLRTRHLTPGILLVLYLAFGIIVILAAGWLFAVLAEEVVTQDRITAADTQVLDWLHAHTSPPSTDMLLFFTFVGGPIGVTIITTCVVTLLIWYRSWYRLLALVLVVPGGAILDQALKWLFGRPRPPMREALIHARGYSFPSGHATEAILLYGLLASFAVLSIRSRAVHGLVLLAVTLLIAVIDFSRLYLGVHYLSDILAGTAAGVTWLVICISAVEILRYRRRKQKTQA